MAYTDRRAAVLAVRVCPADVGRRVSVRERLPDGRTMSDTVGHLQGWTDGVLTIRRRNGSLVHVAADALVAGKVVSPEVSAYDVQLVAEAGWPPERSATLGDWTLRWTHGVTGRANSVRVGGDPGLPLPDALHEVSDWYRGLQAPPLLQIPAPWTHDAELTALGWRVDRRTMVMTAPVEDLTSAEPPPGTTVRTSDAPDDAWWEVLQDVSRPDRQVLSGILTRPANRVFVGLHDDDDGRLLGVGRASAARLRDGRQRWAGITNVEVTPAARRRGVASALVAALGRWAAGQRCQTVYLQLLTDNAPARSLYEHMGFRIHHHYDYLIPGPADPGA